ncbi:Nitrogen permease regulator 3 [Colletotrichum siamense]|uniref:Nitrogen permease regulator 3 n=1 Tax=Colletotrichum siamense TaxID=690259 RepID=A0A9P5BRF2_COLSI|nr:Nitrogen permease regulator 3 [Colletotrichum siamense]KAI8150737.1 Nitrogen permease regulator 3 [Colletotrichum sp. SAR 10_71]KAI8151039.1 Nitrogen permease regulator 3 [Colletotrichum sp. SAR 10_70]KAI8211021.1 Nitrogen permease regulator 3 [Colletotrichum sp. SAR 10_77]KAF4831789.1 Nitrogen permease regulator 3 [Colletotrichum siamense]KAF4847573.1 Nitrogen permease regulator 3 [Colletotrichum siamense]
MAQPVLPNPSNFLAVALVINRSRDGPNFVFHYPPQVLPPNKSKSHEPADTAADSDDILLERLNQPASLDADANADDLQQWTAGDDHLITDEGTQIVPWEHVAGFPTKDLASILTPGRAYHKKLFQLSLDPLYCVSYPIHVPESGSWKKKKKKKGKPERAKSVRTEESAVLVDYEPNEDNDETPTGADASQTEPRDDEKLQPEEVDDKRASMTMFNLVFILNPRKQEAKELIDTLYLNIIKKVNKAYKYCQQHSEFVWKESKRISALKDKGREDKRKMSSLWSEILATSSLAASVQDIYEAVSQNKIAALQLDTTAGPITPSVQIPVPFYVTDLHQIGQKESRGLWLTTANSFTGEDTLDEPGFLDRNFALLLMGDEKKIIAELQADPDPSTVAMVEFARLSKPTQSFYQVGQSNVLTLSQVRKYAQHFIFWRRAIAIPPLHARDIYIMSPNCDTRNLPRASSEWQKTFPLAPPLTNFLAELSYAPRPYKHFCPSKAHRPTYLAMLAWLMRGAWVTQLCTFAYVIVWPEIIYEVEHKLESDELRKADDTSSLSTSSGARSSSSGILNPVDEQSETDGAAGAHVPTMSEQVAEKARLERIAEKTQREAAEKATAHARKVLPAVTDHPSTNDAPHLARMVPYIIVDAKKATGKDSLYLSAIGKRFKDPKVAKAWQDFWKYFNGQTALERIALQEDMKRKEAWNLLTAMSEHLLCVRHW